MKKQRKGKPFSELEREWYERLEKSGFVDIEDTASPDRPLKQWHSRRFRSPEYRLAQEKREQYQKQIDDFINHRRITEICALIARHGNSTVKPKTVKKIIELHREGIPERMIAKKVKRGKKCVHLTIEKAREWMKVA